MCTSNLCTVVILAVGVIAELCQLMCLLLNFLLQKELKDREKQISVTDAFEFMFPTPFYCFKNLPINHFMPLDIYMLSAHITCMGGLAAPD